MSDTSGLPNADGQGVPAEDRPERFEDGAGGAGAGGGGRRDGGGGGQELVKGLERDAMVAAGSFDGADAAGKDPVLEGRVANADFAGGLARREQGG